MKPVSSKNRSTVRSLGLSVILGFLAFPAVVAASSLPLARHRTLWGGSLDRPSQRGENLAQAADSLCREVFRERLDGLVVYEEPNPFSRAIGGLAVSQQVTMAPGFVNIIGDDGQNWLEIVAPVRGYISNGFSGGPSNLVYCSVPASSRETSVDEFTGFPARRREPIVIEENVIPGEQPGTVVVEQVLAEDFCRRVIESDGLAIRQSPSPFALRVGGASFNEEVQLESRVKIQGPEGRVWVPIVYPAPGFISHGYGNASGNLADCVR